MKTCPKCSVAQSVESFGKHKGAKDGLNPYCRKCAVRNNTEWRKRNPKVQAFRTWKSKLAREYGITPETFYLMWDRQGGLCGICQIPFDDNPERARAHNAVAIDHCHTTGKTRALLCKACNLGLGAFKEMPEMLRKAAEYLSYYKQAYEQTA